MVSKYATIASAASTPQEVQAEAFLGFPAGLRTSVPASMITTAELSECVNLQINRGGVLQSRAGLKKLNSTSLGEVISLASCNLGDTTAYLAQSADFVIHKIEDDETSTIMGTAEAGAKMVSYGGYAMVADGGYLKYIDEDEVLKLAWDNDSPGMFSNLGNTLIGSVDYTAANTTQVDFTTPTWPSEYTLEPTKIIVKVGRVGTGGTGDVVMRIHRTSDDAVMAYGALEETAATIAPDPGDFSTAYLTVNEGLAPDTAYYVRLTMDSYDVTNYIMWYTGTSSIPICGVYPDLPPKGAALMTHGRRLWLYEDPEALGTIHYNGYAPFSWSYSGIAGFLTTLDDNKDSYPIGALVSYYNGLFVYGTEEWPYLLQLSGSSGDDFELTELRQPLWSRPNMVAEILNDVWTLSRVGVSSLTGVNSYGDVRTYSESFAIDDQIEELWDEDSFAGYFMDRGQVWVSVGDKVFVAHTKAMIEGINRNRYPWTEYAFDFTPSCFGQWGDLVIGSEEGFIYTPDSTISKDDEVTFDMYLATKYFQSPFKLVDVLEAKVLLDSNTGVGFDVVAYKDNKTDEAVHTWSMASALHDDVTVDDLKDATVNEVDMAIASDGSPMVVRLGFICYSYKIKLDNIRTIGSPIHINGLVLRYRPMED